MRTTKLFAHIQYQHTQSRICFDDKSSFHCWSYHILPTATLNVCLFYFQIFFFLLSFVYIQFDRRLWLYFATLSQSRVTKMLPLIVTRRLHFQFQYQTEPERRCAYVPIMKENLIWWYEVIYVLLFNFFKCIRSCIEWIESKILFMDYLKWWNKSIDTFKCTKIEWWML